MLARRFTIVCLLMTLFGMYFAILVAEASRNGRPHQIADALPVSSAENFLPTREPETDARDTYDESAVKIMTRLLTQTLKFLGCCRGPC